MVNFVFQALALLAFLLPGILFRSAYKRAFWNYPLGRLGPIGDQIPRSLIHASWLNATWCLLVNVMARSWLFGGMILKPDYDAAVYWLTNNFGFNQQHFGDAVRALTARPLHVFLYFFGMYVYSIVCGWLVHLTVRRAKLDRKFLLFRFDNDWYYQFTGEALDFPDYQAKKRSEPTSSNDASAGTQRLKHSEVRDTLIAAVVEFKERSYLYLGIYVDSFYDASGNLDRILLEGAKRRELNQDAEVDVEDVSHFGSTRYYPIKGDYFLLRMSEIKTLNLAYYTDEVFQLATDTEKFEQLIAEIEKLELEAQQEEGSEVTEEPSQSKAELSSQPATQEEIVSRPRPRGGRRGGGRRPRGGPSR